MRNTKSRQQKTPALSFETRRVVVRGGETIATIYSPVECDNLDWLKQYPITLNGRSFKLRKANNTSTLPIIRKGGDIDLIGTYISI